MLNRETQECCLRTSGSISSYPISPRCKHPRTISLAALLWHCRVARAMMQVGAGISRMRQWCAKPFARITTPSHTRRHFSPTRATARSYVGQWQDDIAWAFQRFALSPTRIQKNPDAASLGVIGTCSTDRRDHQCTARSKRLVCDPGSYHDLVLDSVTGCWPVRAPEEATRERRGNKRFTGQTTRTLWLGNGGLASLTRLDFVGYAFVVMFVINCYKIRLRTRTRYVYSTAFRCRLKTINKQYHAQSTSNIKVLNIISRYHIVQVLRT
jgi:hypothetical protein